MWHGHPPPPGATYPFLKPTVYKIKRTHKSEPKAPKKCFYLGPGISINRDCVRILNEKRQAITTSNFTWQSVPAAPTALPQSLPTVAEEEEELATGKDEVREGASSQGRGRAEGEPVDGGPGFNLETTAAPGPAGPPARVAPAAAPAAPQVSGAGDAGDGAPSSRDGASIAPSITSAGMADVVGGEDDRRRSSRGSGGGGSDSGSNSGSNSETDLPALRGPEARRLARFDKAAELTSRRTRENPRRNLRYESPPSPTSTDALLALVASLPVSSTKECTRWMLSTVLHVTEGENPRRNLRYESPPSPTSTDALLALVASLPVSSTKECTRWMLSTVLHVTEGLAARAVRELLFERAEEAHAAPVSPVV
ncbi:unnamed protein product [Ectocarpus sp. CCAP 1310/34]|nr:unnamed protein product [Ectocarpus sp. CCAP 1310/34]